jgi:adenosine deaminase CECR1
MPTMPMVQANRILCDRLLQPDAIARGVQMRFIDVIIRFLPDAEHKLELAQAWVSQHRVQWVGVNMVGRKDNDKGYPLRFLETFRKMRRTALATA